MEIQIQDIKQNYNCLVVSGPTACGKTLLAARLAVALDGAVVSADSRQVYKELSLGCGKDTEIYLQQGYHKKIYGIDLSTVRKKFYLHQYRDYLYHTFHNLCAKNIFPVICGGTGLYLECLRKTFSFTQVPEYGWLRKELELRSKEELRKEVEKYLEEKRKFVDVSSRKRLIRALEILHHMERNHIPDIPLPGFRTMYLAIYPGKEVLLRRIRERLLFRWKAGMKDEVLTLLRDGISQERLMELGLEYKYVTLHLTGKLSEEEMLRMLEKRIVEFARRQMLWLKRMEKEGVCIHWIKDAEEVYIK